MCWQQWLWFTCRQSNWDARLRISRTSNWTCAIRSPGTNPTLLAVGLVEPVCFSTQTHVCLLKNEVVEYLRLASLIVGRVCRWFFPRICTTSSVQIWSDLIILGYKFVLYLIFCILDACSAIGGASKEFIFSGRLDNLAMSYCGLKVRVGWPRYAGWACRGINLFLFAYASFSSIHVRIADLWIPMHLRVGWCVSRLLPPCSLAIGCHFPKHQRCFLFVCDA